jgi:ribosomal protein S18 acetylase RimI-like enzyme
MVEIGLTEDLGAVRELWGEYWQSIGLSAEFQGFARELEGLPGAYAAPAGRLLVAWVDGQVAGTGALRPLGGRACEMKRLYVRPAYRGTGLGRQLLTRLLDEARGAGYAEVYCDTLESMDDAQRMYRRAGFENVGPYSADPTPGAVYLRFVL